MCLFERLCVKIYMTVLFEFVCSLAHMCSRTCAALTHLFSATTLAATPQCLLFVPQANNTSKGADIGGGVR